MVNRIPYILLVVSVAANVLLFAALNEQRHVAGENWLEVSREATDAKAAQVKAESAVRDCTHGRLVDRDEAQRFAARVKAMSDLFLEESVK